MAGEMTKSMIVGRMFILPGSALGNCIKRTGSALIVTAMVNRGLIVLSCKSEMMVTTDMSSDVIIDIKMKLTVNEVIRK